MRTSHKLAPDVQDRMIERLLLGERATDIAASLGVSRSLPALRAYTRGFITNRLEQVFACHITPAGRAFLGARNSHTPRDPEPVELKPAQRTPSPPGPSRKDSNKRAILYLLATHGEMTPREISARMASNLTDVNAALAELRTERKVLREALHSRYANGGCKFKYSVAPEPEQKELPMPIASAKEPSAEDLSRFLWASDGITKLALVSDGTWADTQESGKSSYGSVRIRGPERHESIQVRGISARAGQYMTLDVFKITVDGKSAFALKLANDKNIKEYLEWFPKLALR